MCLKFHMSVASCFSRCCHCTMHADLCAPVCSCQVPVWHAFVATAELTLCNSLNCAVMAGAGIRADVHLCTGRVVCYACRVLKIVVKGSSKELQREVATADPAGLGAKLAAQ